jgi:hypothetical protein
MFQETKKVEKEEKEIHGKEEEGTLSWSWRGDNEKETSQVHNCELN